jgi:hypothetical protein
VTAITTTAGTACAWATVAAVTVNNLHDEVFSHAGSTGKTDKVHRTQSVHTLVLTNDVDVASGSFLEVTDGLATTADDEANCSIRHHDLNAFLALFEWRKFIRRRRAEAASWTTCITTTVGSTTATAIDTAVFNDLVDGRPGLTTPCTWTSDLTNPVRVGLISSGDELNAGLTVRFNPSQVLALTTDDKADQARVYFHGLGTIIITTKRRSIASSSTSWREPTTGTALTRGVGAVTAVIAILPPPFISVWVVVIVVAIVITTGRRARSVPPIRPTVICTRV